MHSKFINYGNMHFSSLVIPSPIDIQKPNLIAFAKKIIDMAFHFHCACCASFNSQTNSEIPPTFLSGCVSFHDPAIFNNRLDTLDRSARAVGVAFTCGADSLASKWNDIAASWRCLFLAYNRDIDNFDCCDAARA